MLRFTIMAAIFIVSCFLVKAEELDCRMSPEANPCSGRGSCHMGVCRCEIAELGRYYGKYCHKYTRGRCDELKDCVACIMYDVGPLAEECNCSSKCDDFDPIAMTKINVYNEFAEVLCTIEHNDHCDYKFAYSNNNGRLEIRAMRNMIC